MMVTSFLDDDKVYPALEAGAVSYILKHLMPNKLQMLFEKRWVAKRY